MDVCLFKGRDGWRYATSGELGPHGDFLSLGYLMSRRQWRRVKEFGYNFGRSFAHLSTKSKQAAVGCFGPLFRETSYSQIWFQRLQDFDRVMLCWCGAIDYSDDVRAKLQIEPREAAYYAPADKFRGILDVPKLVLTLDDFFKLMRYNVRIPADLFEAIRMLPKSRGGEQ